MSENKQDFFGYVIHWHLDFYVCFVLVPDQVSLNILQEVLYVYFKSELNQNADPRLTAVLAFKI